MLSSGVSIPLELRGFIERSRSSFINIKLQYRYQLFNPILFPTPASRTAVASSISIKYSTRFCPSLFLLWVLLRLQEGRLLDQMLCRIRQLFLNLLSMRSVPWCLKGIIIYHIFFQENNSRWYLTLFDELSKTSELLKFLSYESGFGGFLWLTCFFLCFIGRSLGRISSVTIEYHSGSRWVFSSDSK